MTLIQVGDKNNNALTHKIRAEFISDNLKFVFLDHQHSFINNSCFKQIFFWH